MKLINLIALSLFFISNIYSQNEQATIGPMNGTLVIVGGGGGDKIIEEFINAAGGNEAPIVCIPTADGREEDEMIGNGP